MVLELRLCESCSRQNHLRMFGKPPAGYISTRSSITEHDIVRHISVTMSLEKICTHQLLMGRCSDNVHLMTNYTAYTCHKYLSNNSSLFFTSIRCQANTMLTGASLCWKWTWFIGPQQYKSVRKIINLCTLGWLNLNHRWGTTNDYSLAQIWIVLLTCF